MLSGYVVPLNTFKLKSQQFLTEKMRTVHFVLFDKDMALCDQSKFVNCIF